MNTDEDFETKIIVKTNMPDVLRKELRKSSWQQERVALGTATDPYLPCEGRDQITRGCLEALRDGATAFWGGVLRLAPLVKEHYFSFVGAAFPDLLARYQCAYPRSDAPREYRDRLDERIARVKERFGFVVDDGKERTSETTIANTASGAALSRPGQFAFVLPGL